MDTSAIVSAVVAAVVGHVQSAVDGKILRTGETAGSPVAQLIDAAQQDIDSLVNVAAGVGTRVDKRI
jgi:hypothetical protein